MLLQMEVFIVRGLCQHFQDFFWFLMLKMVLNDPGGMFWVILLLQNKFRATHTPSWWYCMIDKYLSAFLSIKNFINPGQISNFICSNTAQTCKEPAPYSTVACRHQQLYRTPARPWTNYLILQPNISNFDQSRAPAAIFLHPSSNVFMYSWVAWPCLHVGGMALWSLRPFLARPLRTVDVCTWGSLVSASSEFMALPDIFQFRRKISLMCFFKLPHHTTDYSPPNSLTHCKCTIRIDSIRIDAGLKAQGSNT